MSIPEETSPIEESNLSSKEDLLQNESAQNKEEDANCEVNTPIPNQNENSNQAKNNSLVEDLNQISTKSIEPFIELATQELQKSRAELKAEIEELSKRKAVLEKELKTSFTGQSDAIARRLKGFQDYLSGAFQELVQSTEQLELVAQPVVVKPSPLDESQKKPRQEEVESSPSVADTFKPDESLIRDCLEQFSNEPDFYAEPWKFRRSLDQKDIELLQDWFFNMGGRGAQASRGNRAKNKPTWITNLEKN